MKTELFDPAKNPDAPFRYVDVSAVSNELWKITTSAEHKGSAAPSRARKLVRADDVIFATVRPTLKRVALVPEDLDSQIVSTAFCVLRADPILADPGFIYYSLLTDEFVDRVGNLQRGASYPAVTDSNVLDQEITVPPLPEQRAIAGVLAKIQAAVEVQEKIVATLRELKAARMAKLFREGLRGEPLKQTDIGEIPESWEVAQLGDVFAVQQGKALSPHARAGTSPRRFLRTSNVLWGRLDLSSLDQMDFTPEEAEKLSLLPGDLLVCEGGEIGRTALWNGEIEGCLYQNHIHRLRTDKAGVCPHFVMYWMQAAFLHLGLYSGVGNKTTIPNLSGARLKQLPIPHPAFAEQEKIAEGLKGIDRQMAVVLRRRNHLKILFSSMLHLLMSGQVRVTRKMIALQALADRAARRPKWSGKVDEKVLEEMVRRIVEAVAPEKIILFGSAVRGEMGPDSDLDFLVIKSCTSRRETAWAIRRALIGIKPRLPIDIIVATPQDIERYKNTIGLIYRPAFREGKVLYAA